MIVELDINFSEMEKSILRKYGNLYGDIDIKLFIQTDKLIHIGVRDGKAYDTIIENPRRMLTVGGQYLLELDDELNEWYMGQLFENSTYGFHGLYGDLEFALKSL